MIFKILRFLRFARITLLTRLVRIMSLCITSQWVQYRCQILWNGQNIPRKMLVRYFILRVGNIPDNLISCRVVLYFLIGEKMSITDLVIGCPGNNGGNIEVGLYFLTVHFSMRLYVGERKHSVTKL